MFSERPPPPPPSSKGHQLQASVQTTIVSRQPSKGHQSGRAPKPLDSYNSNRVAGAVPAPPRENLCQNHKTKESVIRALNNTTAFVESKPPAAPVLQQSRYFHSQSASSLSELHDAVYFNEDDFESDGDLNFDDSVTIATAPSTSTVGTPSLPTQGMNLPPPKTISEDIHYGGTPSSSALVDWSSSPAEHFAKPGGAMLRGSAGRPMVIEEDPEETIEEAPLKKRKVLPWPGELGGRGTVSEHGSRGTVNEPGSRGTVNEPGSRGIVNEHGSRGTVGKRVSRGAVGKHVSRVAVGGYGSRGTVSDPNIVTPNLPVLPKKRKHFRRDMTASDVKRANRKRLEQERSYSSTFAPAKAGVTEQPGKLELSAEQKHVLDIVREGDGKSVFFTGSAGTGKSVLLREVIAALREKHRHTRDAVAVTASTGLAACNIGGVTLHSFAGIGLGKEPAEELIKRVRKNQKARARWLRTKVLVIDEISMVDGDLFDKLERIAREIRRQSTPFGGIQVIITGDFFQLPPVPCSGRIAKFAFDANRWPATITHTIGLTQVFRQRDPEFADILNEMRLGRLSKKSVEFFNALDREISCPDGIEATELFPTRHEVDTANLLKMRQISGQSCVFEALDTGTVTDKSLRDKILSNCMAPQRIELKVNSQVMLIKNQDDTLVNGSLGRIVGFMSEADFDLYREDPESLGATMAELEHGEDNRPSGKGGLKTMGRITTANKYPLVQFALPNGTSRQLLVQPEIWKVELPNGEVQAQRIQIPLILAWALSIHKAQGQTLERVKVDLGKVFEKGQAYVALSRATCQEGLQVLRFEGSKVMAHEKVRTFYDSLLSAQQAKDRDMEQSQLKGRGKDGKREEHNSDYNEDEAERYAASGVA